MDQHHLRIEAFYGTTEIAVKIAMPSAKPVAGPDVTLVSSAVETGNDVYRVLVQHGLERPDELPAPRHRFLATGDPAPFDALARRFLGPAGIFVHYFE